MYTLAPDEKATTVMVYSRTKLIRGNLVTKENVRVSIWPRSQSLPNYLHFLKAEVLFFGGSPPKSLTYEEYFFPTARVIGFHTVPPAVEPLDYDPQETGRMLVDVELLMGAFILKGKVRVSSRTDFTKGLEMSHLTWLSIYDAEITNPFLAKMPAYHVPMLLVNPEQVSFGL